ncbi:hypothetical protein C2845_PM11G27860 [Panicum miliaceum]|uniref:Uncharacterized protein n=1 Tax=Panicum miliaceum TaxID=4540 RepID=A0A3L6RSR3_PANMI|nr:hypothetical protein C2845_PM11G27860 [Panicum miliaceum]
MVGTTRCFRGDRPALAGLRLRRIDSFLRRHRLYDTAHELERQTGAFFDTAHFRRLLSAQRWADASSYAIGFVTAGHCSREANTLIVRVLILRVMADLAAGRVHAVDALFQRLYASLDAHPDGHHLRRILLSMRSDRAKASRLYHGIRPMAVEAILNLAAMCPELKAKARLPRCTVDPAYIMSLGPGTDYVSQRSRGYKVHNKNKVGHIPAYVLARSFMLKRAPSVSHDMNYPGVDVKFSNGAPSAPVLESMLATSPRPTKIASMSSAANAGMKHSRPCGTHFPGSFEQAFESRKSTERQQITEEFAEEAEADILVHCSPETRRPILFPSQVLQMDLVE